MFTDDQLATLTDASRILLALRRQADGVERPCQLFYFADAEGGWHEPVKVCGCNYPVWEVRRIR